MKNLHYSISINASKEKVWNTMLGESTYREWTDVFMPGSYYQGSWEKGSEIKFLAPDTDGNESGMKARIVENIPFEFVSMEHVAELSGAEETPFNNEGGSFENYSFKEQDGMTELSIDLLTIPDEWVDMMGDMWPKALHKLKEISEK